MQVQPFCPLGGLRGWLKQRHAPRAPREAPAARTSPPVARLGRANKAGTVRWPSRLCVCAAVLLVRFIKYKKRRNRRNRALKHGRIKGRKTRSCLARVFSEAKAHTWGSGPRRAVSARGAQQRRH